MNIQDILKPHFLSEKEMELKERNISKEEEEDLINEMVSLVKENIKAEEELSSSQEDELNC